MAPHEVPRIHPDKDGDGHHEEQRTEHVDHTFGAIADRRIDQINTHVAALDKGVCQTKSDDQSVVKLQFFGPPADIELQRHTEAERNVRTGKDTLHEDDHDLLKNHQKTGPRKETAQRIAQTFQHAHSAPHDRIAPKADGRQNKEGRKDDEEKLDRATVVNKPHDGLFIRPVQPQGRMRDRISEIVKRHGDVLKKQDDPLAYCSEHTTEANRLFFHTYPHCPRSGGSFSGCFLEKGPRFRGGLSGVKSYRITGPARAHAVQRSSRPTC